MACGYSEMYPTCVSMEGASAYVGWCYLQWCKHAWLCGFLGASSSGVSMCAVAPGQFGPHLARTLPPCMGHTLTLPHLQQATPGGEMLHQRRPHCAGSKCSHILSHLVNRARKCRSKSMSHELWHNHGRSREAILEHMYIRMQA